ncbi:helix-turn-helix domain-containing protein [Cohnella panacarvi]|uniref:LuxR C-terminal-related transcriptional regulator n=1 Tax=Cohnella panacarvi TaxID=400776 RepID=UPI00047A2F82
MIINTLDKSDLYFVTVLGCFVRKYDLTPREIEVVEHLLFKGYSNREIAQVCFITEKTAKNHIASIMRKTSVKSTRHLASLYINFLHDFILSKPSNE